MVVFWSLAALMLAVALAFVLVPMLRARALAGPSALEANLEVLRAQRREIDADVARGLLPASARDEALADLVGRAAVDLSAPAPAATAPDKRPWLAAAATAVLVPAIAVGVYLAVGVPGAASSLLVAREAGKLDDKQIVDMVESLARKVRERPDDAQGWALLARSMAALGRFNEAAEAYERVVKLVPGDAQVLADFADVLGMAQGRTLKGRPYELARRALEIDPKHPKALALAGTAAMDEGDRATALRHWQTLASVAAPGSDDEKQVREIIAELEPRTGQAPAALPLAAAPGAPAVSGAVSVAPGLATKVAATDTLFVFARAEGGPRFPLAILRATARELPLAFSLDDSMAMTPATRLSSAQAVRIEARISRSGDAMPRPGDLVGTSAVVQPGARDVKIVIDREVAKTP